MLQEKEVHTLLKKVLSYSPADQTEVLFFGTESALTRFANNYIHQNVAETNYSVSIRAIVGTRAGVVHTNKLDDESLRKAVESATEIAKVQQENPEFKSLPGPSESLRITKGFSEATAAFTPERRADAVNVVISRAKEKGFESAGAFETNVHQIGIANSLGILAHQARTEAEFHAVVMAENNGSGWSQRVGTDASTFNFESLAEEAVNKADRSRNPVEAPIGEYVTVLDNYAVRDLLQNLAFMGMNALAVEEGRSFMNGRFGQKVADEQVTIYDDAFDPAGLPISFDYEGVPKTKVTIINKGVAESVVYDSYTANKEGKSNTGHALPAPNTFGPFPEHLMMEAGSASREDLFKGIEKGIYVTRFHYTNVVHPSKTLFTGMTRDGTFLIEHGEITRPVKSFRFTQSVLETLNSVQKVGRERVQSRDYITVVAPALRVGVFNFTGVTK